MQYLFKICLTLAEWFEDWRGSSLAQRETERKTILTFFSQSAMGGMIGYFFVMLVVALSAHDFSPFLLVLLPVFLVFGAVWGAVVGFFIWLPGALLKRRIGFAGRAASAIGGMSLLGAAVFYWLGGQLSTDISPWLIGYLSAVYLPIIVLTGSGIRPVRALLFGAGGRSARRRYRSWLAVPSGFLLRATSIFALAESLLALAFWISARISPWSNDAGYDELPTIVLAITYFVSSTYFSLKTPRKTFLFPIAITLNVPAVFLMITERQVGTSDSDFLAYSYLGFICVWIVYTLGCLLAPAATSQVAQLVDGTYALKGYRNATV